MQIGRLLDFPVWNPRQDHLKTELHDMPGALRVGGVRRHLKRYGCARICKTNAGRRLNRACFYGRRGYRERERRVSGDADTVSVLDRI